MLEQKKLGRCIWRVVTKNERKNRQRLRLGFLLREIIERKSTGAAEEEDEDERLPDDAAEPSLAEEEEARGSANAGAIWPESAK
jgi:hypothetical protein